MEKYKSSRGWRNNNPLNIRRGERWIGLKPTQSDGEFCQFEEMAFGYRAGVKVLKSYYRMFTQTGKPFTVRNIVSRWAPEKENATEAYIRRVTLLLMGPEYASKFYVPEVELHRPDTPSGLRHLGQLMASMTCVECGCRPADVDYTAIVHGIWYATDAFVKTSEIRL